MSVEEYKLIIIFSVLALFLFVGLLLIFFLLSRKKAKQTTSKANDSAVAHRSAQLNQLIKSLDILMDEVESAINAAVKRAEQKEVRLNQLMRQADVLISKLEKLKVNNSVVKMSAVSHKLSKPNVSISSAQERTGVSSQSRGDKRQQVQDLLNKGMSNDEVAKHLKINIGEVELINNLQRKII